MTFNEALVSVRRGSLAVYQEDRDEAFQWYADRELARPDEADEDEAEVRWYINMSDRAAGSSLWDEAWGGYHHALAGAIALNMSEVIPGICWHMGRAHTGLGRYNLATLYLEVGYRIAQQQEDDGTASRLLLELAVVGTLSDSPEVVKQAYERAHALLFPSRGNSPRAREAAMDMFQEGMKNQNWRRNGDPVSACLVHAIGFYHVSIDLNRRLNDRVGVSVALINMGHVWRLRGDFDRAISCWRESIPILEELQDRQNLASVGKWIAAANEAASAPAQIGQGTTVSVAATEAPEQEAAKPRKAIDTVDLPASPGEAVFDTEIPRPIHATLSPPTEANEPCDAEYTTLPSAPASSTGSNGVDLSLPIFASVCCIALGAGFAYLAVFQVPHLESAWLRWLLWIPLGLLACLFVFTGVQMVVERETLFGDSPATSDPEASLPDTDLMTVVDECYDQVLDRQASDRTAQDDDSSIRRLIELFDSGYDEGSIAAEALAKIGKRALPYLIEAIQVRDGFKFAWGTTALEKMGRKARAAIPALQQIADDPTQKEHRRREALETIAKIR